MHIPTTPARYLAPDRLNRCAHWLVPKCPYCGKRHTHGADLPPVGDSLGLRHSHCIGGGQYRLTPDMHDAATRMALEATA